MKTVRLTKGYEALVDDQDLALVSQYKWCALEADNGRVYAQCAAWNKSTRRYDRLYMHCLILGAKGVDHRNSDGLDNRRQNLRVASQSQNLANQRKTRGVSRFKGVVWVKARSKWQAQLGVRGSVLFLGRFDDEETAAKAYNVAALREFGEFARLNEGV